MSKANLHDIAKKMKKLDLCMMTTLTKNGMTASRPMSNNGDVEYDGNSYFFTDEKSELVKDLKANPHVNLSFNGSKKVFISVAGRGQIITNKSVMEAHWNKDLDKWFEDGIDTPGVVMIQVRADRIKLWDKHEEKEIKLN